MFRVYVEKKAGYDVAAEALYKQLGEQLNLPGLSGVSIVNVYDVEGVKAESVTQIVNTILSEPNVDQTYIDDYPFAKDDVVIQVAYLAGQFDQRADSAEACMQILTGGERPKVRASKCFILKGTFSEAELAAVRSFLINPVDSTEIGIAKPESLDWQVTVPQPVASIEGFIEMTKTQLETLVGELGLAMKMADLELIQDYFKSQRRNPTMTEIKAIDTYWSDHCRHTTFFTELTNIDFADDKSVEPIKHSYQKYLDVRNTLYEGQDRPITLMDLAVISAKDAVRSGDLDNLDVSEEINACSIKIPVNTSDGKEDWLLMFKNETHNHPTEIEPFGGAATCLGGAIRDPLSGRAYVYQAMRVTGSGNPHTPLDETLKGKLAQRKITTEAARGYSSYGNQIGLATGQVAEVYHDNYVAKRMEVGCVVGACPVENVVRETPVAGDVVILLGGKTGRDGCGGATGSSKSHTEESVEQGGAEVQKGNAPTERKIQRLFRNGELTKLIKRCNDFGAGGVSVAIGEIADSIDIYLDRVPKKYDGLDGTELAISESQERMAVVVARQDVEAFKALAERENLESTLVADITDSGRLRMYWRDQCIFDIERSFLDTNGASQSASVQVAAYDIDNSFFKPAFTSEQPIVTQLKEQLASLASTSRKGLSEMFDATVGASTVLMPFGGKHQLTPVDGMVSLLPVLNKTTTTCSSTTYGFHPDIAMWSPYHSAYYAVIDSLAKQVALGFNIERVRLSFQEYFEKLGDNPTKWGKPFSALLGAFEVQHAFRLAAIGGKDSMSGSFGELNVPPTLISFAVSHGEVGEVVSPELKRTDSKIVMYKPSYLADYTVDLKQLKDDYRALHAQMLKGEILSAKAIGQGGALTALTEMAVGNGIGFNLVEDDLSALTTPWIGALLLELPSAVELAVEGITIAETTSGGAVQLGTEKTTVAELSELYCSGLESVFAMRTATQGAVEQVAYDSKKQFNASVKKARPRVYIPVFPGTNSEYDMARAFADEGATVDMHVFKNLTPQAIENSLDEMVKMINQSQIIAIPGGFSGGDEPDGSAKFIATIFRNPKVAEAVMTHLKQRDGLMLGICNGFQALIKLGLIRYGEIRELTAEDPTLTHNLIGKHMSAISRIRVASNNSPWLAGEAIGKVYNVAISHGEGRFVANQTVLKEMIENGQIATQYVDLAGVATMDNRHNPNGSVCAVEGAFSPDGRIFGKMGHTERYVDGIYQNIDGDYRMPLFKNGVAYFK